MLAWKWRRESLPFHVAKARQGVADVLKYRGLDWGKWRHDMLRIEVWQGITVADYTRNSWLFDVATARQGVADVLKYRGLDWRKWRHDLLA